MTKQGDNNDKKAPQLTQEQIKQLMAMMQNQKPLPKHKQLLNKGIALLNTHLPPIIQNMERIINFITKKEDADRNDVIQNARGPILFGTYVLIFFFLFGGLWAALAPLDSAAVAVGTVIPSSKRKIIQHPRGGTIKEIFVQIGDQVKKGDKIIELEEVDIKAGYETSLNEYRVYLATEARLIAERDDLKEIVFDEFLMNDKDIPEVATLIRTEKELFESKEEAYRQKIESLEQRHKQLLKKKEGLEARLTSSKKQYEVWKERVASAKTLHSQGHLNRKELLDVESKLSEAQSQLLATEAEIASTDQSISQDNAEAASFRNEYVAKIMHELTDIQTRKNASKEKYLASKDALDKIILRSPVDGTVIDMGATTIGGVLTHAAPVAEILPSDDMLVIEARVPSRNIDSVHVGLKAKIRFSAFKSRTTPVFNGIVTSLSPDIVNDKQQMGAPQEPSYLARIELDMEEFNRVAKRGKLVLRPGMQAEVQIVTGTRTLLRYLLDPITDNMFKAFKEK